MERFTVLNQENQSYKTSKLAILLPNHPIEVLLTDTLHRLDLLEMRQYL